MMEIKGTIPYFFVFCNNGNSKLLDFLLNTPEFCHLDVLRFLCWIENVVVFWWVFRGVKG